MKHIHPRITDILTKYIDVDEAISQERSPLREVLEYLNNICPDGWTEITHDEWQDTPGYVSAEIVDGVFYGPGVDWPADCRGPNADTHHYRFFKRDTTYQKA